MNSLNLLKKNNYRFQTREKDLFVNRIVKRKRNNFSFKVAFRKYGRLLLKIFLLLCVIGLLGSVYDYFDKKGSFKIKQVEISGAGKFVNYDDISTLVRNSVLQQGILSLDTKKLTETLIQNFLGAKEIYVEKKLPDTLIVNIKERVPLAILLDLAKERYLVDEDGYVLGKVGDEFENLPEVRYENKIIIGSFVEKEIVPVTVALLQGLKDNNLKASSVSFYPRYAVLYVDFGTELLISNDKDKQKSLEHAASLQKRLVLEGKKVIRIDLRYDKVIVLYE